jgi:phage terminase small subunit
MSIAKRNGKEELTPKQARFVAEYVANGGQKYKSVKDAGYKVKSIRNAGVQANDNLKLPKISNAIQEKLAKLDFALDDVIVAHKRNTMQSKDLKASNTGIEMYYKITGMLSDSNAKGNNNVGVFIS